MQSNVSACVCANWLPVLFQCVAVYMCFFCRYTARLFYAHKLVRPYSEPLCWWPKTCTTIKMRADEHAAKWQYKESNEMARLNRVGSVCVCLNSDVSVCTISDVCPCVDGMHVHDGSSCIACTLRYALNHQHMQRSLHQCINILYCIYAWGCVCVCVT